MLRDRQDVLYGELMKVHQGSVDSYLQSIIMKTIDNTSSLQAYQEAKLKVTAINDFLDKVEKKNNKPEVIIKDLVSSFLIPDVQRKKVERESKCEFPASPACPRHSQVRRASLPRGRSQDHQAGRDPGRLPSRLRADD